jgi:hypothetical protein
MDEWGAVKLIRNYKELKRPNRVNTRDIRPRKAQIKEERKCLKG